MRFFSESINLFWQGLRLCALRGPQFSVQRINSISLVLVLLLLCFVVIGADWLSVAAGPRGFSETGFFGIGLLLAPLGVIAWICSRRLQNLYPDVFGQVFLQAVIVVIYYLCAAALLDWAAAHWRLKDTRHWQLIWALRLVFFLILGIYVSRVLTLGDWLYGLVSKYLSIAVSCAAVFFTLAAKDIGPNTEFWYTKIDVTPKRNLASEKVQNEQATIFAATLADIQPQRKGVADIYFVAYAPDATEDVFLRELAVIAPMMDQRFDTRGRSVRLQNHSSTLSVYPAATKTNLEKTLQHLGKVMDPAEDVLVLYLTSHGSRRHELVPNFPPMELEPLTPESLKKMLDAAGIRFRVVAVSACYSGGYIDPLKGVDTLIMTASAKDRTSFGCGNESDFTYFGKAVFDEQLRKTYSFEDAFANALPVLKEREAKVSDVLSDPQIAVGAGIKIKLAQVQARLSKPLQDVLEPNATSAAVAAGGATAIADADVPPNASVPTKKSSKSAKKKKLKKGKDKLKAKKK